MSHLLDILLSTRAAEAVSDPRPECCGYLNADEMLDVDDSAGLIDSTHFISLEPFSWTPAQRAARAEFEAAMQAGELRGPPSVFGVLS